MPAFVYKYQGKSMSSHHARLDSIPASQSASHSATLPKRCPTPSTMVASLPPRRLSAPMIRLVMSRALLTVGRSRVPLATCAGSSLPEFKFGRSLSVADALFLPCKALSPSLWCT